MYILKKVLAFLFISRSLKDRGVSVEILESRHRDNDQALFNDSSYFLGRGDDGSYMVVRLAFRNGRPNEYWLSFHIPGHGTFELKDLDNSEGIGFQQGNLKFECAVPGKTWEIYYQGNINMESSLVHVDINLRYEGLRPLVNFKNITLPSEVGRVIAREKWTREFFRNLKEISKTHLEQAGKITGIIKLADETIHVNWRSVRDHSWGTRVWGTWKRHIWIGGVLDNGEGFNLSFITYSFLGQLSAGYITNGDDLIYLDQLPDMESFASYPVIPREASIHFYSRDGRQHILNLKMPHHFDFMMDGEYFIREGMGDFILDGVPAKGVAEFGLNPSYYDHFPE